MKLGRLATKLFIYTSGFKTLRIFANQTPCWWRFCWQTSPNILNIDVPTRPWLSGQITGKQIRIPAIRGIISIIITTKYFLFIASPTVWVGPIIWGGLEETEIPGKHWYRQIEFPEVVPLNKFSTHTSTEFVLCSFFCEGILWLWKLQPSNELHLQDNTMFLFMKPCLF